MDLPLYSRLLRKTSHPVALAPLPSGTGQGTISITFDDFPLSAWTQGAPVLEDAGFKGTYFATGGLCGQIEDGLTYYTRDVLAEITEAGHEIGCHTFDHPSAWRTTSAGFITSVLRNMAFLNDALPGYRPTSFAYPYGDASPRVRQALSTTFATSRGIKPRLDRQPDATLLPAFSLDACTRAQRDWPAIIERAAREKRWLIVFTHDVSETPSPYGCTPSELQQVVGLARKNGLVGRPIGAVAAEATTYAAAA